MFRDKRIIRFFKFPFCGDLSLHLRKMVKEISRNITQARNQDFMWGGANEAKVDQTTEMYFFIV